MRNHPTPFHPPGRRLLDEQPEGYADGERDRKEQFGKERLAVHATGGIRRRRELVLSALIALMLVGVWSLQGCAAVVAAVRPP